MNDASLSACWNKAWDLRLTNLYSSEYSKMIKVIPLPSFTKWINGLMGDVESVGSGVLALRIHVGAGWRVYFTRHKGDIIILLVGGSKRTQSRDIKLAKGLAERL